MAQVTIYEPLNFLSPLGTLSYSRSIYGASSSSATYKYTAYDWFKEYQPQGGYVYRFETFYGQLSYPSTGGVTGRVTGYELRSDTGPILMASLNVDAATLYSYIVTGARTGALAYGLSGNDTINGSYGQDVVTGFTGDDYIDLKGGIDFVYFYGPSKDYSLTFAANNSVVIRDLGGDEGTDTLVNVEYVKFSDWGEYRSLASMAPASYSISANASTISEGQTATFTLSTANVAVGTVVTYIASGVSASDVVGGNLSGSVTIGTDGRATISVPIAADNLTEGNENLTVQVQGQSATITVLDTSKFVPITFTLTAPDTAYEGAWADFVLSGTGVSTGTSVQYALSGVSPTDIVDGQMSGTAMFGSDGKARITVKIANDNLLEGYETLTMSVQGQIASVKITDSGRLDKSSIPYIWVGSNDGDSFNDRLDQNATVYCYGGNDFVWMGNNTTQTVYGGEGNDEIFLTSGSLYGEGGDDKFTLSAIPLGWKNSVVDGGAGTDLVIVNISSTSVRLNSTNDGFLIVASDGSQFSLKNVERISFRDTSIALDVTGNAGKAYRVYKAAFARDPMTGDKAGLGYWISNIDKGMNMVEVAARFIDSTEFRGLYGQNPSNADFLTKVYTNVLGRTPDQGGYNWWLNELNTNPAKTKAKVLADFAESQENKDSVATLIGNGIQYTEYVS